MTVSRQKLQELKKQARQPDFIPSVQVVHTLLDHGLAVLDELEGGQSTIEQRAALKKREQQVGLAVADLRALLAGIADAAVVKGQRVDDLPKAVFAVDMIGEMLRARGPAWLREWSWYQPRIAEEFGE